MATKLVKNVRCYKQKEEGIVVNPTIFLIYDIMDKHQIGLNAGVVWRLLNDNKRWNYCDLKKASGLSDKDLNTAIGWLAREDKIDFDCNHDDKDCFFLSVNVYIG